MKAVISVVTEFVMVALRHVSTIGKNLVKQQYLLHTSAQYCELRPTSG